MVERSSPPFDAQHSRPARTTRVHRLRRRRLVRDLAATQGDVLSRRQLFALGLARSEIAAELRAERWRALGRQAVQVHTGEPSLDGRRWAAIFEAGPRAVLDGVSALQVAGLEGYEDPLRISVPRGARVFGRPRAVVRQTRRLTPEDRVGTGIPRVRPATAAIRAALWAPTDRQAALILTMSVGQGLVDVAGLHVELARVLRHRRRRFIAAVLADLAGGVRALGELDFARLCRRFGLPEPTRQVERQGPNGRIYLDVLWAAYGVVVEIDGIHHAEAGAVVADALRQNHVSIQGDVVLRVPLLGLRTQPEVFLRQIREALVARGWAPTAA